MRGESSSSLQSAAHRSTAAPWKVAPDAQWMNGTTWLPLSTRNSIVGRTGVASVDAAALMALPSGLNSAARRMLPRELLSQTQST